MTEQTPVIRPLTMADVPDLTRIVVDSREHLRPWEPRRPERYWSEAGQTEMARAALTEHEAGRMGPYVILDAAGAIAGRINLNNIVRGAAQHASIGYWVGVDHVGRGLATRAVGALVELAWGEWGLHRVEAGTLVHNTASQKVLARNGFQRFGLARRYLSIDGRYQDHVLFERLAPTVL